MNEKETKTDRLLVKNLSPCEYRIGNFVSV